MKHVQIFFPNWLIFELYTNELKHSKMVHAPHSPIIFNRNTHKYQTIILNMYRSQFLYQFLLFSTHKMFFIIIISIVFWLFVLNLDASMEHLWKDGKGLVYKETLSWLKSNDENLLIAGALATGNFARKGMPNFCYYFKLMFHSFYHYS